MTGKQQRRLGSLAVSALGLGCMGMSAFSGQGDDAEFLATIGLALDRGCTFLDTADMYGPFTDEQLVGRAIASRRDEVVLAKTGRLEENLGALEVSLSSDDLGRLDELAPVGAGAGDRCPGMSSVDR